MISRLVRTTTTKKKMAIKPSFIQWLKSFDTMKLSKPMENLMCQSLKYHSERGELAKAMATMAAENKTMPLVVELLMNRLMGSV